MSLADIAFLRTGLLGSAFAEAAAKRGKDTALMLQTIGAKPMAMLPATAACMDQLIAAGHGAKDASAMAIDAVCPK